jgi:AGCS family alanine or glycine:cation symporter
MDAFTNFLGKVDDIVWGLPLIILIIVCGIYLTIRLKFLQIVHLPKALIFMIKNEKTVQER